MSKLTELIEKKKERKQSMPTKGSYYSKKEDFEFEFKKCDEELFFYLIDKFPLGFSEQPKMSELLKAMNNLIYECVVIDGNKSLQDPNQYDGQIETVSFEAYIEGDLDILSWENEKYCDIEISFNVDPSTLDWDALIDIGRQDMLTK